MASSSSSRADARLRAKALVAQVKQRVARQDGAIAPPDGTGDDVGAGAAATRARLAKVQGHPAGRAQRMQGRREGN